MASELCLAIVILILMAVVTRRTMIEQSFDMSDEAIPVLRVTNAAEAVA